MSYPQRFSRGDEFIICSEGAASLNDMKDMLANLPQYQEQREKVHIPHLRHFID